MFKDATTLRVKIPEPGQYFRTLAGPCLVVSLASFLHRILPPLHHGTDPLSVVRTLRRTGKRASPRKPITLQGHWRGFSMEPRHHPGSEEAVFLNLKDAVNSIVKASGWVSDGAHPRLSFETNVYRTREPSQRNTDSLPDASLFRGARASWESIVVCGEHLKSHDETAVSINSHKIVISMSTCMQCDPRRRFVLGYTIENTNMRFWYYDRSQVVVSEAFDFTRTHTPFVHLVVSCLFASPEQLGFDQTMVPLGDGCNYDITVQSSDQAPRTYRTVDLLYKPEVSEIRSKGTRVWKAVPLDHGLPCGPPVVLKDVWTNPMFESEGSNLEKIRVAAEATALPANCFLTVLSHGDVLLQNTTIDCTRSFLSSSEAFFAPCTRSELLDFLEPDLSQPEAIPRIHYRIVFAEICRPIHRERSPVLVFRALAQLVHILCAMHRAGWVHRDVSVGNILLDAEGRVRLSDFEYSKVYGDGPEFRTGTSSFISVEVDNQEYCFQSASSRSLSLRPLLITVENTLADNVTPGLSNAVRASALMGYETAAFRYNPLHDMESVWWIAVHSISTRQPCHDQGPLPDDEPWDLEAQRNFATRLFVTGDDRLRAMVSAQKFYDDTVVLHPLFGNASWELELLRRSLVITFKKVEKDVAAIDCNCADGLYDTFAAAFLKIAEKPYMAHFTMHEFPPPPSPVSVHSVYSTSTSSSSSQRTSPEAAHDDSRQAGESHVDEPLEGSRKRKVAPHEYNLRSRAKKVHVSAT